MSVEKEAQENPAQPAGWAQGNPVSPDAHPDGELVGIEQQKRQDTAEWEDAQNRSPIDGANPAQPPGFAVPEPTYGEIPGQGADAGPPTGPVIVAKVFAKQSARSIKGAHVLLGTNQEDSNVGQVIAADGDKFWVSWNDGEDSIEKKAHYELIIDAEDNDE